MQKEKTMKNTALNIEEEALKKREYGAYYTPKSITDVLAKWAIRTKKDKILEPSFGGCGFLESSYERLISLGQSNPISKLFGCDRDTLAFNFLAKTIGVTDLTKRFLLGDFLESRPSDFKASEFDVVIGNPPYVSMHAMSEEQRASANHAMQSNEFFLGKRASLWAYFVLHSLSFIKRGGRCAWVLPNSFLHTEYAKYVHSELEKRFKKILIITLEERLFTVEGARERTLILLADHMDEGSCINGSHITHLKDSCELTETIDALWLNSEPFTTQRDFPQLDEKTFRAFNSLRKSSYSKTLASIAEIKIGIVTGANKFFVINESIRAEHKLAKSATKAIFAKNHQTSGLSIKTDDLVINELEDKRCLLLDTSGDKCKLKSVEAYLDTFPKDLRESTATFKKRGIWHRPDDNKDPDAFLTYMCDHGPRLILNKAKTTSTNTIHRVYFKEKLSERMKKLIAISAISSFSQLSAELHGRSYGSGVLKIEPSESKQIDLIIPEVIEPALITSTYNEIDKLLRSGFLDNARHAADELIIRPILKKDPDRTLALINESLIKLRKARRQPGRHS